MIKHFAATAYIAATIDGEVKVLLHKHKKLGIWIGVGGHVEKEENPKQAVIREAKEETDLEITLVNQFCVQEEKIPKYKNQAAHGHIDFIYFAFAKNPENIKMEEEYGWFSLKKLDKMDLRPEARHAAQKSIFFYVGMYKFWGKVRTRSQRGQKLGFPTANINLRKKISTGIYISKTKLKHWWYPSLTYIGDAKIAENYILDFAENIYSQWISVELIKKIRDNKKFAFEKDLIDQIKKDEVIARQYFTP